jgi:hypothetical protein
MLLFIFGFLSGISLLAIAKLFLHKHDYEILLRRCASEVGVKIKIYSDYHDNYYQPDLTDIIITYKKCKKCGKVKISVGDGTKQKCYYNDDLVKDACEAIIIKEKRLEDEKILNNINNRLDEKYDYIAINKTDKPIVACQ